jgi:type II secretory pathway pseudopilin PulG
MDDNKGREQAANAGFTFVETLFAAVLVLIIAAAGASAFYAAMHNKDNAFSTVRRAYTMLSVDQKLREKIQPVVIPYWKNSVTEAQLLCEDLRENFAMKDITLITAAPILKNGAAHGIAVAYRIGSDERVYQCACLFSSAGDGVERDPATPGR